MNSNISLHYSTLFAFIIYRSSLIISLDESGCYGDIVILTHKHQLNYQQEKYFDLVIMVEVFLSFLSGFATVILNYNGNSKKFKVATSCIAMF